MEPTRSDHPHEGHHRSARERQRKGPMWGCLKALFWIFAGGLTLLFLVVGGGWWYLGSSNFAGFIQKKVANTLEARLGRKVYIHDAIFIRGRTTRVILNDVRIANAPGGAAPYFAT